MSNEFETFELGDVVTLKSGGQRMTVNSIKGIGFAIIECVWFHSTVQFDPRTGVEVIQYGSPMKETFGSESLQKVT